MNTERQLLIALNLLTEGAVITEALPSALRTEAFATEAVATQRENRSWVFGQDIQGLGIGEKITEGEKLRQLALKVYVKEKKPLAKLRAARGVPKQVRVAGVPEALPTDVEAIGEMQPESNTTRVRPAIPGFGLGHPKVTVGTFGCLVRKTGDNTTLYILSNSHVLADEGLANVGDDIIQPGRADGGRSPADRIARLAEFVPFQFTATTFPNVVDAAIARVRTQDVTSAIRIIGVPKGASTVVRRGMQVQKTGRTTDHTIGVIKDINFRTALQYKKPGGGKGRVGFFDQVLCTRYTAGGDSGSAVLNMNGSVVGLHFAGSPTTSTFNKIARVRAALGIDIVTTAI